MKISLDNILDEVAAQCETSKEDILGPNRYQDLAIARQMFYFVARRTTMYSWSEISATVNRTHASAIHGYNKLKFSMTKREQECYHRIRYRLEFIPENNWMGYACILGKANHYFNDHYFFSNLTR